MKFKLTKHEEKQLGVLLEDCVTRGGLGLNQAKGFLAHLHCHPRTLDPSLWSSAIAGVEPEKSYWPFEADTMDSLFMLYNQVHQEVVMKSRPLPTLMEEHLQALERREIHQPLREWLAGYYFGYQWLRDAWKEVSDEEQLEEIAACAELLGYVATLGSEEPHAVAWRNGAEPEPTLLIDAVKDALNYMQSWHSKEATKQDSTTSSPLSH
ncbi:UPF0149 family protein [Ferrimonas gelatinilytica]|uniref:UPF0149 family protein n=2 Tax=Ferrimonas gelatinilytica TaxID=1255257 RepID=A0ABP9SHE3_9GAMM